MCRRAVERCPSSFGSQKADGQDQLDLADQGNSRTIAWWREAKMHSLALGAWSIRGAVPVISEGRGEGWG